MTAETELSIRIILMGDPSSQVLSAQRGLTRTLRFPLQGQGSNPGSLIEATKLRLPLELLVQAVANGLVGQGEVRMQVGVDQGLVH